MYVRRTAPEISLAEIPYSKATRVSGRINDANTFKTASFSRADLFIIQTLLLLHNSMFLSNLCQLTKCGSHPVERPYNAERGTETKGYDPAQDGRRGCLRGEPGRFGTRTRRARNNLLGALARIEQAPVLENCVAIGHSSDVIRDGTSPSTRSMAALGTQGMVPIFRRHETYVLEKSLEELL